MTTKLRYVGLDVHAETIAVAVAEADGEVRSLGLIPNRPESVGRMIRKLGKPERIRRGAISKAGNAHLRRIVVEAAWAYRHRPAVGKTLAARQRHSSAAVTELAWKAQQRLHQRYVRLMGRGKSKQQTITAVGRELLGFVWAIGVHVEREAKVPLRQAA